MKRKPYAPISSLRRPLVRKGNHELVSTKSIEELPVFVTTRENGEEELFESSSIKITRLREKLQSNTIDRELDQILIMIRTEKQKIAAKTEALKQKIEYYEGLCKARTSYQAHVAVNTDFILDCSSLFDSHTQTTEITESSKSQYEFQIKEISEIGVQTEQQDTVGENKIEDDKHKERQNQIYRKLVVMLEEMKINPCDVLPEEAINIVPQIKQCKQLGPTEIIKIQKFLIKKLVGRIQK